MRPFPPGHASISCSAKRELASIRDSDTPGMCLLHIRRGRHASYSASGESGHASISHSAKPACVHFRRSMRLFPGRLNASLRLFRDRMARACVNSGFRHARHASIAHSEGPACVIFGFGGVGACVHFAFGQAGWRPFPPGHASISGSAKRELASISGSDGASMRQFGIQTRPACVYCTFGGAGMRHIRLRRTRGMRPFRIRPSRLASISAGACVYFSFG